MAEIEVIDVYSEEDEVIIISKPSDQSAVKDALQAAKEDIEFTQDEVAWFPKDQVTLSDEDIDKVVRFMGMLGENDDVTNVYHNIENMPEEE